jgi:hypothetical protein
MHDMPIHAGYEISREIVKSERSIIFQQAENRLDAQKSSNFKITENLKYSGWLFPILLNLNKVGFF